MLSFVNLKRIFLGLIIASLGLAIFLFFYNPVKNLKVNFLDVGQGDSVLIQTPYDQNILIDAGDTDAKVLRQLPEFMPFWDKEIDMVMISHPHDDHIGGLVKVLERYKVKEILYTGVVHSSPAYLALLKKIKSKNIKMTIIDRPQKIWLGEDLFFDIVYPFESLLNTEVDNLNNSSIIAKLVYQDNDFLFSGDAEKEIEEKIIKAEIDLKSDVFKSSHHGSITSNSEEFLELINPQYVIVQVGEDNDFGHPSLRVLKRLERQGIEYYRNDLNGWISVVSDGENIEVIKEK